MLISTAAFGASQRQAGGLAGNPIQIGACLDVVQEFSSEGEHEFEVRALEINIGAAVDPFFDFVTTISWHEGEIDIEEAWVSVVLPLSFKFQFGRELLPFGYLNRIHEHDFPQVDQPYAIEGLMTDHGLIGDGGHLEWLSPLINPTLSLSFGMYYQIEHSVGRRFNGWPIIARLSSFWQNWEGTHAIMAGASYVSSIGDRDPMEGRLDGSGETSENRARGKISQAFGVDFKYRFTPRGTTYRGLTLGAEYVHFEYDPYEPHVDVDASTDVGSDSGFYAYAQWDFNRFWGIGYRFDHTDVLFSSLEDDAMITAHSIYAEWRGSEFSRIRMQYQLLDEDGDQEHLVMLQGTFFVGWHPPHRF